VKREAAAIWAEITEQARAAIRGDASMESYLSCSILEHSALPVALSKRLAAKLAEPGHSPGIASGNGRGIIDGRAGAGGVVLASVPPHCTAVGLPRGSSRRPASMTPALGDGSFELDDIGAVEPDVPIGLGWIFSKLAGVRTKPDGDIRLHLDSLTGVLRDAGPTLV